MEEKLFDIPVYVCSREEFNNYWNSRYEKNFRRSDETDSEWISRRAVFKEISHRKVTWEYHAIIGYIGVYKHGFDLFTTLSIDIRKRKVKGGIPDIYYDPSTFFKVRVRENMTSEQVMDEFKSHMDEVKKGRLRNRYIDCIPFYNFCKYIDWHDVFYPLEKEGINFENKQERTIRNSLLSYRTLPAKPVFEK